MAKPELNGTEKSAEIVNDAAMEGMVGGAQEAGQASNNGDFSDLSKELSELMTKFNANPTSLEIENLPGELSVLTAKFLARMDDLSAKILRR